MNSATLKDVPIATGLINENRIENAKALGTETHTDNLDQVELIEKSKQDDSITKNDE